MPRKVCYWTRKLELDLVEFVRQREFIWKPFGNTNHQIEQKYKAYAEFAAQLGRGYTARSVRDRWVNIRSTFNHNLRRVDKSKETARSSAEVYSPCWPLWKPLQFLREIPRKDEVQSFDVYQPTEMHVKEENNSLIKEEVQSEMEDLALGIRQRGKRTDRPRRRSKPPFKRKKRPNKCVVFIQDLIKAMRPVASVSSFENDQEKSFWYFGKHVTERLNAMRDLDASCASKDILALLNECVNLNSDEVKSEQSE